MRFDDEMVTHFEDEDDFLIVLELITKKDASISSYSTSTQQGMPHNIVQHHRYSAALLCFNAALFI